jgi:hypothetical protein
MEKWRELALLNWPSLRDDQEDEDFSITQLFIELLPLAVQAHRLGDREELGRIYGFAEGCFRQADRKLHNAAAISFYAHLGDKPETLEAFPGWVSSDVYAGVRELLIRRAGRQVVREIELRYV